MLSSSADLKTSACTASGRPHPAVQRALAAVPAEVLDKFYGCGAPLPLGIAGLRVLDLGCGSGRDCYAAAALGAAAVTGVDMTLTQLAVRHLALLLVLWQHFCARKLTGGGCGVRVRLPCSVPQCTHLHYVLSACTRLYSCGFCNLVICPCAAFCRLHSSLQAH